MTYASNLTDDRLWAEIETSPCVDEIRARFDKKTERISELEAEVEKLTSTAECEEVAPIARVFTAPGTIPGAEKLTIFSPDEESVAEIELTKEQLAKIDEYLKDGGEGGVIASGPGS